MSDNRTSEECLEALDNAYARLKQLRTEDPLVYGIKRTRTWETRYHTRVKGMGLWQVLATDLNHSALWLAASRPWAEEQMHAMATVNRGAVYEIIEIPKADVPNLPCWRTYSQYSEFGGTSC